MKISIIYHSKSGNTESIAGLICKGIEKYENMEVKKMIIDNLDTGFINESKVVIIGSPIYSSSMSWQVKQFFDTAPLNLSGKLGGVFTTHDYPGGGGSLGEIVMIAAMLVRSMLIYSGGVFEGQPHSHLGAVSIKDGDDWQRSRAVVFGERMARKAIELFESK